MLRITSEPILRLNIKSSLKILTVAALALALASCAIKQPPLPVTQLSREAARQMKKESGYWIEIQIPQRKLVLAKGDHIIKSFPIAVGMPSYPTPVGWKKINTIVWNPWWYPPPGSDWVEDPTPVPPRAAGNPLGEIKIPLDKLVRIHGTRVIRSIGQWASHGCVRMIFEDIFGLVQLLLTEYSDASAIAEMERANRHPTSEFTTRLNREVPVLVTYDTVKVNNGYVTIAPDLYSREGDMVSHISDSIRSHIKDEEEPAPRRIKNLLKMFKGQTIYVPLESLVAKAAPEPEKEEEADEESED